MKGGGRRKVDNILKLWYAPLIATDLGKYFLPLRLKPMECRWGWGCLVALRTLRIRYSSLFQIDTLSHNMYFHYFHSCSQTGNL